MLRTETVEKRTLDLVRRLMADSQFDSFNLVGGTALALLIGHRKSIDIDLFSPRDFDSKPLAEHIARNYTNERISHFKNGIFCRIDGIKGDILTHKYTILDDIQVIQVIRMLSLKEIGAMKLNAIHGNGTRLKDFVDMHALLERHSLRELLDHAYKKYVDLNPSIMKQALIHHGDIDFSQKILYIGKAIEWVAIAERLRDAFYNPNKIFKSEHLKQESESENEAPKQTPKQLKKEV